ncbi:two-component regulator propeller domain-containing protein [Aquimarina sp. AU119]|uniref:ligand-binding sensor domain-containing protein n=1 Tax=Aquimarina sp. AU119 TaxID=2108528 RepID=UPI000D699A1A|nr:sensor histidine kinase [Aquimarina sp. AU119]
MQKNKLYHLLVSALLSSIINYGYALQEPSLFLHLTANDGLSQGYISSIIQDKKGFMWFGTKDGLNRYDGYEFKIYNYYYDDPCSIQNNFITAISEDTRGTLWIGTLNGLYSFDPFTECFQFFENKNLNAQHTIKTIHINTKGIVWMGTSKGDILRFNPNKNKTERYTISHDKVISHIKSNKSENRLYIEALKNEDTSIYIFDIQKQQFVTSYDTVINNIGYSHQMIQENIYGELLLYRSRHDNRSLEQINLTTKETCVFYKPNWSTHKKYKRNDYLYHSGIMIQDNNGAIWQSTNYGLEVFDPKNGTFSFYPIKGTQNSIKAIWIDQSGIIWLGTMGYGVFMLAPTLNNIETYKRDENNQNSLDFSSIRSIYEDTDKNIWIGGYGGLDLIDVKSGKLQHYADDFTTYSKMVGMDVYEIYNDPNISKDILWISIHGKGLFLLDKHQKKFTRYPKYLYGNSNFIFDIVPENKNKLWIGTSNGLYIVDITHKSSKVFRTDAQNPYSIPSNKINTIYKDRKGVFWVGTEGHGFAKFDKRTEKFIRYKERSDKKNRINSYFIYSFYEDKKGNFWIATNGGGLNLFDRDKESFKHYTVKDGLPNNVVYGILEDKRGNLWISTNKGLSMFNPTQETFVNYDKSNGLQGNEFNANAYFKNKEGKMFFGGTNGVNAFQPEEIKKNTFIPQVALTRFKKFNKEIPLHQVFSSDGMLELSYEDTVISFDFSALSYYNHHLNQYAYKLEGLHEDWINLGTKNTITLTNLSAKNYTLRIKASNNHGVWNEEGMALAILVKPPFWSTPWFLITLLLLFVAFLYVIYSFRIRYVQQQKRQLELEVDKRTEELKVLNNTKDRFFAIIAHDLRGPLISFQEVPYLIDHFVKNNELDKIEELSHKIKGSSVKLNNLLDNLLKWAMVQQNMITIYPEKINLYHLVNECLDQYIESIQRNGINVLVLIDENIDIHADYNTITSMVRNLLSNAIKYTKEKGLIQLKATYNNDKTIRFTVQDNGIGMNRETIEKLFDIGSKKSYYGVRGEEGNGLGLILCKEFAKLNDLKLEVESIMDKGSQFHIIFPYANN